MRRRLPRALILDSDPDTLLGLQRVLEDAEIDTTVTWDEEEAFQLLQTTPVDLLLIGDHPPELDADAILDDLTARGTCPHVLVLRGAISPKEVTHFRRMGAVGVVPTRDPLAVLDQVTKALGPTRFKTSSADMGIDEAR